MISGDAEIPGRGIIFSPEVLFTRDADAWDMELVVGCAVKGADLTNWGWFDWCGVTDPV